MTNTKINVEELKKLVDFCVEINIPVSSFIALKLNWKEPNMILDAIRTGDVDLIKKFVAADCLERFGGDVFFFHQSTCKLKLEKDMHKMLVNLLYEKGEMAILRKFVTKEVKPTIRELNENAINYLFNEYVEGIKVFNSSYAALVFSSEEDRKAFAEMVLDGYRKLKTYLQEKVASGVDINFTSNDYETDEETGLETPTQNYVVAKVDGKEKRIRYYSLYVHNNTFLDFILTHEQMCEFRQLQTDIENMFNVVFA